MRVLALDCSTFVGWAVYADADAAPLFGTWRAPNALLHSNYGRSFVALEAWLLDMLAMHTPDVIAFEAPIMPFVQNRAEHHSSPDIVRLLTGLAAVIELVAHRAGKRCVEVAVQTAKKRATGSGRATKREVINAIVRLGHLVEDDHQADAIAVALVAYDHVGRGARLL